jgi:hypothetical protein
MDFTLMIISIILLFVPLLFQIIFGYKSFNKNARLPLIAICIISIFSQVILTFVSFGLFIISMVSSNEKCLSSSVGFFAISFFISIPLVVVIIIQTIIKVLNDKKQQSITL